MFPTFILETELYIDKKTRLVLVLAGAVSDIASLGFFTMHNIIERTLGFLSSNCSLFYWHLCEVACPSALNPRQSSLVEIRLGGLKDELTLRFVRHLQEKFQKEEAGSLTIMTVSKHLRVLRIKIVYRL